MRLIEFLLLWVCSEIPQVASQGLAPPPTALKKKKQSPNQDNNSGQNASSPSDTNDRKPNEHASHYREHTERSIETADADFYCLDGFILNSQTQRCERNDDKPSDMGCPFGWDYRDGVCQTTDVSPADRYCLDGYQEILGRCQRVLQAPKQLLCPPAYNHTEFGCVKDVETDVIVQCPEGQLINGACAQLVEVSPVVQCEPEFSYLGTHCGRRLVQPAHFHCPPGFVENQDRCINSDKTEPTLVCPAGTILKDGLCHGRRAVAAVDECAEGTLDLQANLCSFEVAATPYDQCPMGTEPLGDVCLKDEIAEPELSCPPGAEESAIYGCISGKGPLPPSKSCPPGFSLRDKGSCHRRLTLPREFACPKGFALQNMRCVALEYASPIRRCPENAVLMDKSCWQIETFLPENVCPESLTLDTKNNYCYGEYQAPKLPICERGTYDEGEKGCVLAEVAPSILSCPPGARMVNGVCQEQLMLPPRVACPRDFTLHQSGTVPVCRGRALAEGELGCIEPYEDGGEECIFTEIMPKMMGCLNGGQIKGTSCINPQSQPPVVLCPDGYGYDESTQICRKLLWARPVPICPKGFVYDNLVQKCYKLKKKGEEGPGQKPPEESNLPLEVQPESTTTTKQPVKAKIRPQSGKEQFIPMATFTGPDAVKQANNLEALKLANTASGQPVRNVLTPPVHA